MIFAVFNKLAPVLKVFLFKVTLLFFAGNSFNGRKKRTF
ncbi:hypothetical protein MuYL_2223 [Mucilaginibacter xinganensis]|uniref:Uncharacterized protein n=1 Tax=Mucilaginibacter xinganensis TaxID=1234841 RepID=A0A223NW60_9SPHI|nr:hypothetical protein MuYL_2223 [Mucilaginibacter xinganensis]